MSDDRGLYADIVSNGAGGIMASIEGQTYGPGVPSLDPGLQAGDSVPVGFMHPGSSRQPLLLARRPILKEISQGVLDHFIGKAPTLLATLWVQGGASELISSFSLIRQGVWLPYSAGGSGPVPIQQVPYTQQNERPLGLIAYVASNGSRQIAWMGSEDNIDGTYATKIYVRDVGGSLAGTVTLSNHTLKDSAHIDNAIDYGFLFFDRASGLIVALGSVSEQFQAWAIDPLTRNVVTAGQDLHVSLHQCSVGQGYLCKMWTTADRDPTLYPNGRPQQDKLWRFWSIAALDPSSGLRKFISTGTIDPTTLLSGYQIAVTKGVGQIPGLIGAGEEGRCPMASTGEVVAVVSGWQISTGNTRDGWANKNNGIGFVFGGGVTRARPANYGLATPDLIGGHRQQSSCIVWINPKTQVIRRADLPINTATFVDDTTSITAWVNYYSAQATLGFLGSHVASNFAGRQPFSKLTWRGMATDGALELGGGPYTVVRQSATSAAPCYTDTPTIFTVPTVGVDALAPGGALTGGSGTLGTPGSTTDPESFVFLASLKYPDYAHFQGGHQMMLPCPRIIVGDQPANDLITWPLDGLYQASAFKDQDSIDGVALDSADNAYFCRMEPYLIREGEGALIPQYTGSSTLYNSTSTFTQCSGLGPDGTSSTYYTINNSFFAPDFDVYLAGNIRQGGKTFLYIAKPGGTFTRVEISNYLNYLCTTPGTTNTLSSLTRTPLDPTVWKPIILESLNLLILVRVWRDALYPGSLGTEHFPYLRVELYALDTLAFVSHLEMPEYLSTVSYTDTFGNVTISRKWDFLTGLPLVVKGSISADGYPAVNIITSGIQNLTDGTTSPVYRVWQLNWTSGSLAGIVYDCPNDYNHPTDPVELGSLMFADGKAYFLKQAAPNWLLQSQALS